MNSIYILKVARPFLYTLLILLPFSLVAQPWMESAGNKQKPNFNEIQNSFNDYWEGRKNESGAIPKGQGYKPFKRWEWFWEPRVGKSGVFPDASIAVKEWEKYKATHPQVKRSLPGSVISDSQKEDKSELQPASGNSGAWTALGPSSSTGGYMGVGRLNCIAFHPTDVNTFWVGTPAGGLWKTTTGGTSWTTVTDNLPALGVSSIVIDPTNVNIMYIGTGDRDAGDTYSLGVLKSTDGGATWNATGLSYNISATRQQVKGLLIHPTNPQILIAATSSGIYRTTNGGTNWALEQSGDFQEIRFKPGDPTIVYASTLVNAQIFRSTNTGDSWTQVSSFIGMYRIALAVSPADPSGVGALCSNNSYGFGGYYKSTNSGATFTVKYTSAGLNLLHERKDGVGTGGQGFYDLSLAISPVDANIIYVGGVNTWKSIDGGLTWTIVTIWSLNYGGGTPVVHADKHAHAFNPLNSGTLYECNDGGLYKTSDGGTTWTDLSNGLQITQFYRLGNSTTNPALTIAGAQDNGTKLRNGASYTDNIGGDGMEALIDYTNANIMYGEVQNGEIYKSTNGGTSWAHITSAEPAGPWVTPYVIDPNVPQVLYAGLNGFVYKTANSGTSWTRISTTQTTQHYQTLAVAPSNTQVIFAATYYLLYKTVNGGGAWTTVTLPSTEALTSIEIHPTDPNIVWTTFSGYSAGQKVYRSNNGGATWTNLSGTLPNLPANTIEYDKNTGVLYLGNDVGVFVRDANMVDWQLFDFGLPNVVVNELEIQYSSGSLRAATYGRGLWQSPLISSNGISVSIESPLDGTNINSPANIDIKVFANATNTTLTKVEFFNGATKLGEDLSAPYSYSWNNVLVGNYSIIAKATDNVGASSSATVSIIVQEPAYCTPISSDGCSDNDLINNFSFNTLTNNSSGCSNTSGVGYTNYAPAANRTTTVTQGQTYTLSMQSGAAYPEGFGVWIDYNGDKDFEDAGEFVYATLSASTGVFSTSITIPGTATPGQTRIRVRCKYNATVNNNESCSAIPWGESEDYTITINAAQAITFTGRVFLQGAYNTSTNTMNNSLNTLGILQSKATSQPYNIPAFGNYSGSEAVAGNFFSLNTAIVDWVLVEIRNSTNPATVVARKAAFIKQDGSIVGADGLSPVTFPGVATGNYHVAVRHRNHLGVRTSTPVNFSTGTGSYDFTTSAAKAFQNQSYSSTAQMGSVWVMRGGNANSNSNVRWTGSANDQSQILNTKLGSVTVVLTNVYTAEDLNLNGNVRWTGSTNDQSFLLNTVLGLVTIVYVEQL